MALTIANNVSSLTAQHHLGRSSRELDKSLEKLASGLKVNRGADGPTALVISEKQRAQIAGLKQAIDNTEKGISLVQTAEGALAEINSLLVKIRSLAIDSANTGVNDDDALRANQQEIDNALDTIDRIANNTQFGIKKLLDGTGGINGTTSDPNVTFLSGNSDTTAGIYAVNITTPAERAVIETVTQQTAPLAADEILTINSVRISLNTGSTQTDVINRINEFTDQTGVIADNNTVDGRTRIYSVQFGTTAEIQVNSNVADAVDSSGFGTTILNDLGANVAGSIDGSAFTGDGAVAVSTSGPSDGLRLLIGEAADPVFTVTGLLGNVFVEDNSLVFQIGPNQYQSAKVAIDSVVPTSLGLENNSPSFTSLADIRVDSADSAQQTIGVVDAAIDDITTLRGLLGAFQQNTLDSTANSLRATLENTVNAESVIRDTDFAEEVANFTKHQVLVQAGTSVLSSANQSAQLVLSLLNG